ncbi:RcnB family protein [Acinetobacter variabilis]|uniref:RcnB family protein n=1 Tax=Acinetobacter variabilis TaxID=70346 RepID=UPI003AF6F670
MKNLVKAVVFSLSSALVATSAFAAAPEHYSQHHQPQKTHVQQQYHAQHKSPAQAQQHKQVHKKVDPSRDWRVGQKVPTQFQSKIYKVDHSKYKKLSKPGKNQQWIKVNGDYILTNVMSHNIIKIIAG